MSGNLGGNGMNFIYKNGMNGIVIFVLIKPKG